MNAIIATNYEPIRDKILLYVFMVCTRSNGAWQVGYKKKKWNSYRPHLHSVHIDVQSILCSQCLHELSCSYLVTILLMHLSIYSATNDHALILVTVNVMHSRGFFVLYLFYFFQSFNWNVRFFGFLISEKKKVLQSFYSIRSEEVLKLFQIFDF